jgi:peptidoglycan hydrolase-like protein with peptidoglycan-binding domain
MRIAISSGHGLYIRGAKGFLDEVDENRRVTDRVAALLRGAGVTTHVFHDNASRTQSANISAIVTWHNRQARDRDVSVHFNAFNGTARGTEVLWVTQSKLASDVSAAIARAGGFVNRGGKKRTDLGFLNRVAKPAILLEVCFVDNRGDADLYKKNFEAICRTIAETIGNVKISTPSPQPPPVEPPPPPPTPPPQEPTGQNVVDIVFKTKGHAAILVNNDLISGDPSLGNAIKLTLEHEGDVIVTVDGEDFQIEPGQPPPPPLPPPTNRPTIRSGSRGVHVVTVQEALGVKPVDGIFGSITDAAVKSFQRQQSLTADGVVGPITWGALERVFSLPPYEPPSAPLTQAEVSRIASMAGGSAVARYNWLNRGRAPPGFIKGVAVSYACAVRGFHARLPAFVDLAKAKTGDGERDALTWYDAIFRDRGMPNDVPGLDTLRHTYVFLIGLGMRESTGRHCVGRDVSASNVTAETAEAGAWQTSWNARHCSPAIMRGLFDEYEAGAEGYKHIFEEGVTCTASMWSSHGSGDGRKFQDMAKNLPRFACEVAGVSVRNLRKHYGPINRREAEVRVEADEMLLQVQELLEPVA